MADDLTYSWPASQPPPAQGTGFSSVPDQRPPPQPTIPPVYVGSGLAGDALLHGAWNVGKSLYEAGPGTIHRIMSGELQPGTPEAQDAATTTALTYGLPGGAPAEEGVVSAGTRIPRRGVGRGRTMEPPPPELDTPPPPPGHNQPPARAVPRVMNRTAPTQAQLDRLKQGGALATPRIGQGTDAPMFDLSKLGEKPEDVAQTDLPRYVPPRGVPERYEIAMTDPANRARFQAMVERGLDPGRVWYGTQPLRHAFHEELGPEMGQRAYERYLDYVGATSPRSKVGENVRNASYYFGQERRGEPVIGTQLDPGRAPALIGKLPQPYGHMAQRLHVQNVRNLRGIDPVSEATAVGSRPAASILDPNGFPIFTNPKPPSFTANLRGNWQPVTADVHNVRGWNLGDIPGKTGYGYMEDVQQKMAEDLGIDPAQLQAAGWVGGELETGVKSGGDPFMTHFENRVRFTAKRRGETPNQTLRKFMRGEADLLHAGSPASAAASGAAQASQQQPGDQ